jgi:hypothetical protein
MYLACHSVNVKLASCYGKSTTVEYLYIMDYSWNRKAYAALNLIELALQ